MKRSILISALILMIAGFSATISAQSTVTGTTAAASIITPISLTETAVLNFGTMSVLAGTPGTCVLSTAGVRSQTGGVNLSVQAPVATNAAYTVGGAVSTTYAITLPATITVTKAVTLETMTIGTLLAHTASSGVDGLTGTLSGGGADSFTVGGTLSVAAAQVAGTYSGTFNVTVAYN